MARSKQLSLIPKNQIAPIGIKAGTRSFGGELNSGKRKVARPLATNRPIHLVLKSTKAKGDLSFLNHQSRLDRALRRISKKWGVALRKTAWVGNHVHLIFQIGSRRQYQFWIRELTAALVRVLSERMRFVKSRVPVRLHSLSAIETLKSFFDHRPFTRVIEWGRDYRQAVEYLILNQMEAVGLKRPKKLRFGRASSLMKLRSEVRPEG